MRATYTGRGMWWVDSCVSVTRSVDAREKKYFATQKEMTALTVQSTHTQTDFTSTTTHFGHEVASVSEHFYLDAGSTVL